MLLSTEKHEVEVAYDSKTAYAIADRLHPQVALVDLSMPGTDGFQMAQHLRQKFPSMLLIAISGHAEDEHTHEAGFDHHLLKPVSLPSINKILASSDRIDSGMHKTQVLPSHTTN
jgi:CheY-like chemotaxis protein